MESRRWGLRLAGASIWVVAALTWGSIAHHLWGLPDFGIGLAIASVALVLALPLRRSPPATHGATAPALLDNKGPSRP
jgi:hypothetical protein